MKKLKTMIIVLILFTSFNISAQTKFGINYSIGIPLAETSDIFEDVSWRGVNIDFNYFLKEEIAIGFSCGWQVFDDSRGYVTETTGTETISGYRFNYLNSVPLFATGSYYFKTDKLSPYVSLGVGVVYNQLDEDIGLISYENEAWQFGVRPEIGLDYEIYYGLELRGSVRYHYVADSGDLPNLSYLGITLGFVWVR